MESAELIAEAERIGQWLLATAVRDETGLSWLAMAGDRRERTVSLYNGTSGVAVFLVELAGVTGRTVYLDAAEAAMRWVQRNVPPELPYGFYSGRLGIAWALLKMGEVSGEDHTAAALDLARGCLSVRSWHTADLLGGVAGTLLGLLHLHAATGEPSLLDEASALSMNLVERALPARVGFYWDRSPLHVRGLCGLSHGAAGVGWVFAELARYTGNDAFAFLTGEAFAYERDQFDGQKGNWRDNRSRYGRPEDTRRLCAAYRRGDLAPFYRSGDMNAWCHGAAGIGLARLRVLELEEERQSCLSSSSDRQDCLSSTCARDLERAVRRVAADFLRLPPQRSADLCHGAFGNAALLHAAAPRFPAIDCEGIVHRAIAHAVETARRDGGYASGHPGDHSEDAGLFLGSAGIGHFLLRVAAGERTDPLLLPSLPAPKERIGVPAVSEEEIRRSIAARNFPRLHALCDRVLAGGDHRAIFASFRRRHPAFATVADIEERRWSLAEEASITLLAVREKVHAEDAGSLNGETRLRLSESAALVPAPGEADLLLYAAVKGTEEVPLQPLSAAVLRQFVQPCTIDEAVRRMTEELQAPQAGEIIRTQVHSAFAATILVPHNG